MAEPSYQAIKVGAGPGSPIRAEIRRLLKPGGILAVEQHRAPEGGDPRAGTGYVRKSYVIEEARKAGFVLEAKSEINANPKDTKDHPFGVWTLPRRVAARWLGIPLTRTLTTQNTMRSANPTE